MTIYFDLETGGLADTCPIIQIAAIAYDDAASKELEVYQARLKFNVDECEPAALDINHYDPTVWAECAIAPSQAVREFAKFMEPFRTVEFVSKRPPYRPYTVAKLAGHNAANFDGPRLMRLFKAHNQFLGADPRIRCTLQKALWWFDERGVAPKNFQLATLCEHFGIPVHETHDALADVGLTIKLSNAMRDVAVAA